MDLTDSSDEEIQKLIREIPPLVERVHNDYNKFFVGAEKTPPVRLRDQLEKLTDRARHLQRQCQNSGLLFRLQNTLAKYTTYKAIWDKKLSAREHA